MSNVLTFIIWKRWWFPSLVGPASSVVFLVVVTQNFMFYSLVIFYHISELNSATWIGYKEKQKISSIFCVPNPESGSLRKLSYSVKDIKPLWGFKIPVLQMRKLEAQRCLHTVHHHRVCMLDSTASPYVFFMSTGFWMVNLGLWLYWHWTGRG